MNRVKVWRTVIALAALVIPATTLWVTTKPTVIQLTHEDGHRVLVASNAIRMVSIRESGCRVYYGADSQVTVQECPAQGEGFHSQRNWQVR